MAAKKNNAPRKRAAPGCPIPKGFRLKGVSYMSKEAEWRIGTNIGVGGFGVIFTASTDVDKEVPSGEEALFSSFYT